jgi:hypothetical protein
VISLGQPHSFALDTVFGFVPSHQCEATLVQALLDRPMFEIRWRWNVTRSLTVLRRRNGKRIAPHLIKMRAADTLSVVFPAAQACGENIVGDREIPDHPLVFETIRDCLVEAMDLAGLREMIERLERGEIQVIARDTVEPSPLSHELLNANPYAYLDDAPLEERRTRAVQLRRGLPATASDDAMGTLDDAAIALASEEVAPTVRDADELHDALLGLWLVPESLGERLAPGARDWFAALTASGRACRLRWVVAPAVPGAAEASRLHADADADADADAGHVVAAWVATERLGAARAVLGDVECVPSIATPSWSTVTDRETAILRTVGAHLDHRGPVSARALAGELGLPLADVLGALLALEADGAILRGSFTSAAPAARRGSATVREAMAATDDALTELEWCNRRVLARIHRLTLARLRKEIEPVSAAALMRFILRWQRVARHTQLIGADGLLRIVEQLQGFETAAGAWEREVLPARLHGYDQTWLDQLCLAGQVAWCRLSPRRPAAEPEPDLEPEPVAPPPRLRPAAAIVDKHGVPYNLAEAGAEAARLGGATRDQIAAAAAAAIAGKCSRGEAAVIIPLVTMSAMLRRGGDPGDPGDAPAPPSKSSKLAAALDRARNRTGPRIAPTFGRTASDSSRATADGATPHAAAVAVSVSDGREPLPADREPYADRREPYADGREPLADGREPYADGREPHADRREPYADGREPLADRREPYADGREPRAPDREPRAPDREPRAPHREPRAVAAPQLADGSAPPADGATRDARELFALETLAMVHADRRVPAGTPTKHLALEPAPARSEPTPPRGNRSAPSRSAPLALLLRRDASWLRAAAAVGQTEPASLGPQATRVRDHLATAGASFLSDLVDNIELPPDEIEDALWELVGAGLATADGFASLRVLVSRRRGEVKSHFDRITTMPGATTPVRKWQDAIRKARTRDRERPGHALRSLPTAAGRWSLLPSAEGTAIDAEASARQLLHRYGVVFRDLLLRESSLPPWRDLLVALRRLEARGEIRGGRFVSGFVGEQFGLPEALDELRGVRNPGPSAEACRVAATDPTNLVGILSPGPRVPAIVGNLVLYLDGHPVASLEAGRVVLRAPLPPGARIDDDLTYHPPPRPIQLAAQAALPL